MENLINNNISITELTQNLTLAEIQEMAQLELLNLQGKTNRTIIQLSLLANGINYNYTGDNLKTFAQWKSLGYSVCKGEKALLQCELWTPCKYKSDNKEEGEDKKEYKKMFLKKSSLFSIEQVKLIEQKKVA